ncbi:sugar phosphate isomerase/epimerase, partial [Streptomyces sp. MCAF7]
MNNTPDTDDQLRRSLGIGRRRFLSTCTAVAAGAIAAPVLGASPVQAATPRSAGTGRGHALVPADKRGIILYTVRDAIGRDPLTTSLPSGFRAVFEQLARFGYRQVEFSS